MQGETPEEATVPTWAAKAREVFGDAVIDKCRLPASQLTKRGIPAYVAEWALDAVVPGQGPLSEEEARKVQEWAARVLPGPGEARRVRHELGKGMELKVLTPVEVEVALKRDGVERYAVLQLLEIPRARIPETLLDQYPALLQQGMWGLVKLLHVDDVGVVLTEFKPMQAVVDRELFRQARRAFTVEEWRDLLVSSMGYEPARFSEEEKTWLLCRLLPLVQKSCHLLELAPKGTGKSYLYENISPQVRVVSGGNVSPAVMFVNNATGRWGILGRYRVVVLDEVQTLRFENPAEIVGGLKGFLANGKLSRGGLYESASDCSFVMLANIQLDDRQQPLLRVLVEELPEFLRESAFLDRLRGIIPGWRVRKLTADCFAQGVGLKADFFGEALLALREELELDALAGQRVRLRGRQRYQRNEVAVKNLVSGLAKLHFPHGEVADEEFLRYCVRPAEQLRQQVWSQLWELDGEFRQFEVEIACALT